MNNSKKNIQHSTKAIFTVIEDNSHIEIEVFKLSELNKFNINKGYSFVSKNESYMSRLENAEKIFDKQFDLHISK